jgi:hypothetical protein
VMRVSRESRLRLAAARLLMPLGIRRLGLERLFALTAAAFGSPVPRPDGRGPAARLAAYARFTREQADAALALAGDHGAAARAALDRRLYRAAHGLGAGYRRLFGVRSLPGAMSAARFIYRNLGVDFQGSPDGGVIIRRCGFARTYTPQVCGLVSALDRGLMAGLAAGGELRFQQRITEGADSCRACLEGVAHA